MKLYDLLLETADTGSRLQDWGTGRMPSGHNGPWNNIDTSVRNSSHWTIVFLTAYEYADDERYYEAAKRCVEFLLSDIARPSGHTFQHRKDGPDRCNGLIGQAWTLEALIYASKFFDRERILSIAEDVFLLHPYDSKTGMWHSVDVDGTVGQVHSTFNQQIWFAAVGAKLKETNETIDTRVRGFLDELVKNIRVKENGLIVHNSYPHEGYPKFRYDVKNVFSKRLRQRRNELAIGYHSFNLYGMGLLYNELPDHSFWDTDEFQAALTYPDTTEFLNRAKDNQYCFGYNPTGFELAFADEVFPQADYPSREWIERQLSLTYDPIDKLMKEGPDQSTLISRFYEASRLSNIELDEAMLQTAGGAR